MKRFKKILVRSTLVLLAILLLIVVLAYVFKDSLLAKAQKALSKQLNTEIAMEKLDISPFSHLPYIGIHADRLQIQGAENTHLLHAEQLDVFINPLQLFKEQLDISHFLVTDGTLKIIKTPAGNYNYQFNDYAETDPTADLDLPSIQLENIALVYEDKKGKTYFEGLLSNYKGQLKMSQQSMLLAGEGNFRIDTLRYYDQEYAYPEVLNIELYITQNEQELLIEKCEISDTKNEFILTGSVNDQIDLSSTASISNKEYFADFIDTTHLKMLPEKLKISATHTGTVKKPIHQLRLKSNHIDITASHSPSSVRLDGRYTLSQPHNVSPEIMIDKGRLQFSNFVYHYSSKNHLEAFEGSVSGKNIAITKDSLQAELDVKEIYATSDSFAIDQLEMHMGASNFSFSGGVHYVSDRTNITGNITSQRFNEKDITPWISSGSDSDSAFPVIDLNVDLEVKELEWENWKSEIVKSNWAIANEQLSYSGEIKTCEGIINIEGTGEISEEHTIKGQLEFSEIDVNKLLTQFDNFGQITVTDKNLYGKIKGAAVLDFDIDKSGNINPQKSTAKIALQASEGKLVDLQLLQDFSTYVDAEELADVHFESMTNYFEWKNNRLQIPVLFIKNNAANFLISGFHDTNNRFAYNLQLNAGEVLAKKLGKKNKAKKSKAKREGWWNVYYYAHGYPNDFKVDSNKDLVQKNLQSSFLDKENIFFELIKTFGYNDILDQLEEWEDIPEYYDNN